MREKLNGWHVLTEVVITGHYVFMIFLSTAYFSSCKYKILRECLYISNLRSKSLRTLFYSRFINVSVYKLVETSNNRFSCQFNVIDAVIRNVQRHVDLIKIHAVK